MMLVEGHLAFEEHLAAGIDRCYDVSSCFMLNSWVMPILNSQQIIIRHDITQLSNYPRISQVSGHDGSDHESPGSPVGVSGSWFGFGVRGARHSSFGTEDWKFKQTFSSIKSSQIIYQIAQK